MRSGRPSDGTPMLNGAQALIRTLVDAGVTTCFTNPGTSEMHFVTALDTVPQMRAILTLVRGRRHRRGRRLRADGRPAGRDPAAPRSRTGQRAREPAQRAQGQGPIVNIVGDHATYHSAYDAQLQSDIETVARNVSIVGADVARRTEDLAPRRSRGGRRGHRAARPGRDTDSAGRCFVGRRRPSPPPRSHRRRRPSRPQRSSRSSRDGAARRRADARSCSAAGRLREAATARRGPHRRGDAARSVYAEVFPTRLERGAGLPPVERARVLRRAGVAVQLGRHQAPDPGRRKAPGVVLRLPRQAELPGARRLRGARARRRQRRRGSSLRSAGRRGLAPRA